MPDLIRELSAYLNQPDINLTVLADGSGVLLDIAASQVITLNDTGVFLTEAIKSGEQDSDGLVAAVMATYAVDEDTARGDVSAFTDMLRDHLLITPGQPEK